MNKVICIDDSWVRSIADYMEAQLHSCGYGHEVEALRRELKKNTISLLQNVKSLRAIVIKIQCNVKQFTLNTHFITENIFTQTTYYKTLTSRP